MGDLPAWLSAVAAVVALAVSAWTAYRSVKSEKRATQLDTKSAELNRVQAALAHQTWSDEYFREITNWASEVSLCLSSAIHHLPSLPNEQNLRCEILTKLSWAIDSGRWFFPNTIMDQFGSDKPPAYQGYRQPILDWLVLGYEIVKSPEKFDQAQVKLTEVQRSFVSLVQARLDPREREMAINRVLDEFVGIAEMKQLDPPKND